MKTASILLVLFFAAPASAQTWPTDAEWTTVYCGRQPSFDPVGDEPTGLGDLDVVGDSGSPALYISADTEFLFFRMRVDAEPTVGTDFNASGWGVELDTDRDRRTYEVLGALDGVVDPDEVILGENTNRELDNPADRVERIDTTYDGVTNARAVLAAGTFASAFNGDDDFFVDTAFAWADLAGLGIDVDSELLFAMGTSSDARSIDIDLACHDAGPGEPTIVVYVDVIRPDGQVVVDTDGDGFSDDEERRVGTDPNDPNSRPGGTVGGVVGIRGGPGGCAIATPRDPPWFPLLAALFVLRWRAGRGARLGRGSRRAR